MFNYIQAAWVAYKKNYAPLIYGLLIILAIDILVFAVGILLVASIVGIDATFEEINRILLATQNIALNPTDTSPLAGLTSISMIFLLFTTISALLGIALIGGYVGMIDDALHGRASIKIGKRTTLFEVTKKRGIATILVTLITYFIVWATSIFVYKFLLILVPGLAGSISEIYMFLITMFLYLAVPATVLDRLRPFQAISKSVNIVNRHFLSFFFLILFYSLVFSLFTQLSSVSQFSLFFSVLTFIFLIPMFNLSIVKFYRDRK